MVEQLQQQHTGHFAAFILHTVLKMTYSLHYKHVSDAVIYCTCPTD